MIASRLDYLYPEGNKTIENIKLSWFSTCLLIFYQPIVRKWQHAIFVLNFSSFKNISLFHSWYESTRYVTKRNHECSLVFTKNSYNFFTIFSILSFLWNNSTWGITGCKTSAKTWYESFISLMRLLDSSQVSSAKR